MTLEELRADILEQSGPYRADVFVSLSVALALIDVAEAALAECDGIDDCDDPLSSACKTLDAALAAQELKS